MKENFHDAATSDLIYDENGVKPEFKEKKQTSSDPYKELWFNGTIPKESVHTLPIVIIHNRLM